MRDNAEIKIKMSQVEFVKDLGILFDKKLNFSEHVDKIVAGASCLVGLIRCSIHSLNKQNFGVLFKTLVRPKLKYNNTVWNPQTKHDCIKIESVQRRATKMPLGFKNLSYSNRFKALNLPTLVLVFQRLRGDCIQVFKYLNDYYDVDLSCLFQVNLSLSHATRGHNFKLSKLPLHINVHGNFFSLRVVNNRNALPRDVVSAPSLSS